MIGDAQTINSFMLANTSCSSSCPFGLTSVTAGDLYPIESALPLSARDVELGVHAHDTTIGAVDGAALDLHGGEFSSTGGAVLRLSPIVSTSTGPEYASTSASRRPAVEMVVDKPVLHDGRTIRQRTRCPTAKRCQGQVRLTARVTEKVRRHGKLVGVTSTQRLGSRRFSIAAHRTVDIDISLNAIGRRWFAQRAKRPRRVMLVFTDASGTTKKHTTSVVVAK